MVEHNLAKVGVGSSNLLSRSKNLYDPQNSKVASPEFESLAMDVGTTAINIKSYWLASGTLVKNCIVGAVAEWSCSGLQLRVRRFDSDPRLHYLSVVKWESDFQLVSLWYRSIELTTHNHRLRGKRSSQTATSKSFAGVVESVDTQDLKSCDLTVVPVQVRPPAPFQLSSPNHSISPKA